MGICIDLYIFEFDKLIDRIKNYTKSEDTELIEKVLSGFGTKFDNKYVILNNELYEDGNPYFNVSHALCKALRLDEEEYDIFGECICGYRKSWGVTEGISYAEVDDTLYELNIDHD